MILAIISHTEHFLNSEGKIVGWGATVRELNNLVQVFDKVIHIAPLHKGCAPTGMLPYESDRIVFMPLKPAGGNSIWEKLEILRNFNHNLKVISKGLEECDVFQFRAPTGLGVLLIPYLLCHRKNGWFKYAGNWAQKNPPFGYRLQRLYLSSQNQRVVTINGRWPGQKKNQLTFENPCLTADERISGEKIINTKNYSQKLDFIFIGRLEDEKGVQRILNTFTRIHSERIGTLHFVGDGPKRKIYEQFVSTHMLPKVVFHGYLTRNEINTLLEDSHIFLLPSSASEGFPKVIAEAANYGLIPIVSDVSSIGQYIIDDQTGFIVESADENVLYDKILHVLKMDEQSFQRIASNCHNMAAKFTYAHYNYRIKNEIVNYGQY